MAAANGWMKRAGRARNQIIPTDPASRQLAAAVADVRNAETLKRLAKPDQDEITSQLQDQVKQRMLLKQLDALDGHGNPVPQDEMTMKLNAYLNQRLALKQLESLDAPKNEAPKDIMQFAEGAVNIQKAAADTALGLAAQERELRREAEESIGGAVEEAVKQERSQSELYLKLFAETKDSQIQREKENAALMREMLQAQHSREMAEVKAMMADLAHSKDQEAERIRAQAELEKERLKNDFDLKLKLLDKDIQIDKLKSAVPVGAAPEYQWQMDQIEAAREDRKLEREQKKSIHASDLEIRDAIVENIPTVLNSLTSVLGGGLSPNNPLAGKAPKSEPQTSDAPGPFSPFTPPSGGETA